MVQLLPHHSDWYTDWMAFDCAEWACLHDSSVDTLQQLLSSAAAYKCNLQKALGVAVEHSTWRLALELSQLKGFRV